MTVLVSLMLLGRFPGLIEKLKKGTDQRQEIDRWAIVGESWSGGLTLSADSRWCVGAETTSQHQVVKAVTMERLMSDGCESFSNLEYLGVSL